jgi:hypothetical protein
MIQTRSRKTRIAAGALGAAAVVGASVFGIAAPASATVAVPVLSKLSASKGNDAGGTVVTITGKNLTTTASVAFNGTTATVVQIVSDTLLTVTVPAKGAGTATGRVIITDAASGVNVDTTSDDFTYVTPIDGVVTAGTLLNPTGKSAIPVLATGAFGATADAFKLLKVTAKVGTVVAPVTYVDVDHVTVAAPSGTPSATAVGVTMYINGVAGATSTVAKYASVITGLSKTSGPLAGGATITVTGKGLTGATAFLFGAVAVVSPCTAVAGKVDTSWTCVVPATLSVIGVPVTVSFTPLSGSYGTLAGATYTYTDVS